MPESTRSMPIGDHDPSDYKILIACEHTGTIRDALIAKGFTNTTSCDLKPTATPGPHIQADVTQLLTEPHDLIIAHPPCTYLCCGSIRHWNTPTHTANRPAAIKMFNDCLNANAPHIAVENPRMPLNRLNGQIPPATQCIQPWQYGHPYTKRTCWWTKNLPRLRPTHTHTRPPEPPVKSKQPGRLHLWTNHGDRTATTRSTTFPGIANAIADQWGSYLTHHPPRKKPTKSRPIV